MTAASLVTEGNRLADVGTDHGYIPIYLLLQKKIKSAIAMDINKGPLQRAKEHISLYELGDYIETRLSDGVAALQSGEVDSILIAGMGGGLVMHILEEGKEVCKQAKELILQPQSEIDHVRAYLRKEGYEFLQEEMVLEDEKFYPMMKVRYTGAEQKISTELWEIYNLYGGLLLEKKHPVLKTFLLRERELYAGIAENLKKQATSEKILKRMEEVEEIRINNEKALCFFEEK